ncbi:SSU ribosomal protein S6P [Lachnospiraceae bacterium]|jgi:small subunit ribosomal protein S6|nr:SSU ribosomal protein S6P [Lachnospiraceae bacterium]
MNKYEFTVVINGKLEEDAKNEVLGKVKALVERFGGEIKNVDEWGKKRFAYEIQKMKEGYYTFIKFEAEPTAPAEIENRMRIMDNVVRYLIVSDELADVQPAKKAEEAPAEKAEESAE